AAAPPLPCRCRSPPAAAPASSFLPPARSSGGSRPSPAIPPAARSVRARRFARQPPSVATIAENFGPSIPPNGGARLFFPASPRGARARNHHTAPRLLKASKQQGICAKQLD